MVGVIRSLVERYSFRDALERAAAIKIPRA
jgi:hypothetical protein